LIDRDVQGLYRSLGLVASELFDTNLINFCSECYNELGVRFLNLYHQIHGMKVCYKHKIPLRYYRVGAKVREYVNLKYVFDNSCLSELSDSAMYEWYRNLAEDVHCLMSSDMSNRCANIRCFREIIKSRLGQLGYITAGVLILQKKLHVDFEEYLTIEYLKEINSVFIYKKDSWLTKFLLGKSVNLHSIRGIAIINFLFNSISEFF